GSSSPGSRRSSTRACSNTARTRAGAGGFASSARSGRKTRMDEKLRVLVVDDHDVVHWGFRLLLERQSWVESCAAATTGEEALAHAKRLRPHVALVDLFLQGESGAEVAEELHREHPGLRILLISGAGRISPAV